MSMSSRNSSNDLVANMRHTVSRAVGVAGLTVAVSLPAATAQTSGDRGAAAAKSLQHVQEAVKAAGPKGRALTARGQNMAWGNWQNWNNWRNY